MPRTEPGGASATLAAPPGAGEDVAERRERARDDEDGSLDPPTLSPAVSRRREREQSTASTRLLASWHTAVRTARLMIGVPDYEAYLAHLSSAHPATVPMDRAEFFRSRQDARYRRGGSRCC